MFLKVSNPGFAVHVEEARECHTVAHGIKVKEQETPKGATPGAGHMALIAPSSHMSEPLILEACFSFPRTQRVDE